LKDLKEFSLRNILAKLFIKKNLKNFNDEISSYLKGPRERKFQFFQCRISLFSEEIFIMIYEYNAFNI